MPLGGDDLSLELIVEAGAELVVRAAAAAIALRGDATASRFSVRAVVAAGARLTWLPEPLVSTAGSRHEADSRVELAAGASLLWREEVVLGRSGEDAGAYRGRLRVDRGGAPLLRHELRLEGDWADGPAVLDGARAAGTLFACGPSVAAGPTRALGEAAALMPLARDAVLASALAGDAVELRRALDAAMAVVEAPSAAVA
jgi:urease accessory protein